MGKSIRQAIESICKEAKNNYSFEFVEGIAKLISAIESKPAHRNSEIDKELLDLVEDEAVDDLTRQAALYTVGYYYRRFDSKGGLDNLIPYTRRKPFNGYLLVNEILVWFYSRDRKYREAIKYSEESVEKSNNDAVRVTYATTVCRLLEERLMHGLDEGSVNYEEFSKQEINNYWKIATRYMNDVSENYSNKHHRSKYPRYCAIQARLIILNPNVEYISDKTYDEAIGLINEAISLENEHGAQYMKRYAEYRQLQITFDYIRMNQLYKNRVIEIDKLKKDLERANDNQLSKSFSLLSIFTAIISIVLSSTAAFSNFTFRDSIYFTFSISLTMLFMVSFLSWLLYMNAKRSKRGLISAIVLLVVYVASCVFFTTVK